MNKINNKMRLFVEAYEGNAFEAMRIAGYEGTDAFLEARGNELLRQPMIQDAIKERSKYLASTIRTIATREERQALWTAVMRNEDPHYNPVVNKDGTTEIEGNIPMGFRLKASEYLGKSEADFVDRVDIRAQVSITDVINEAYSVSDDDLEEIEAAYEAAYQLKQSSKTIAPPKVEDLI